MVGPKSRKAKKPKFFRKFFMKGEQNEEGGKAQDSVFIYTSIADQMIVH